MSQIHDATRAGDVERVRTLLDSSPDLVREADPTDENRTPLHVSAAKGNREMAELLLARGADVNAQHIRQCDPAPLHLAADNGFKDVVELLLANGADPNANDWGTTPLHRAAGRGHKDIVELLLARGADPNAKESTTRGGATPLHKATTGLWVGREVARLLLEKGADPNARDKRGRTPLHVAGIGVSFDENHKNIAELLLASGADINAKDDRGQTPLHLAAQKGVAKKVQFLVANGAGVTAREEHGRTPLDASESPAYDRTEVAELLLATDDSPVAVTCEKCGSVYTIGLDAASITAAEVARMFAASLGRIPTGTGPDLMIGRTKTEDKDRLRRDRATILRLGPKKGWTCQKCHHDNPWRPVNPNLPKVGSRTAPPAPAGGGRTSQPAPAASTPRSPGFKRLTDLLARKIWGRR